MDKVLLEKLAALSHNQWAGWARWMRDNWDGVHPSGESYQQRWRRQINTAYADLSEVEKHSDRVEAGRFVEASGMQQLLDRIARLRAALDEVAYPEAEDMPWREVCALMRRTAREARDQDSMEAAKGANHE